MHDKNGIETRVESEYDQSYKAFDVYLETLTSTCSQPRDSQKFFLCELSSNGDGAAKILSTQRTKLYLTLGF